MSVEETTMVLINVRDVEKHYQLGKTQAPALVGVNLEVRSGERLCLMGPSGSGKSTLLNIIGCIDKASAGSSSWTARIRADSTTRAYRGSGTGRWASSSRPST